MKVLSKNAQSWGVVSLSFIICLLFFNACQKEDFNVLPNGGQQAPKPLPETITEYRDGQLKEVEILRNTVAIGLGKAINADHQFRSELFASLVEDETKSLVSLPVLKFFQQRFSAGTGLDILKRALQDGGDVMANARSNSIALQNAIESLEPNMVLQIPEYVKAFFLTPETVEIDISAFGILPFAFFPEISTPNDQGVLIGYGDETEKIPNGIYGVYPQGQYLGYIPVHVKTSRYLVVVSRDNRVIPNDIDLQDHVKNLFSNRQPGCMEDLLEENADDPDFLPAGQRFINLLNVYKVARGVCPPFFPEEICGNGVDDDMDGLSDEEDPDCITDEICDNNIDDDNDGFIDALDPDCFSSLLTCPEDAFYYRDCEPTHNNLTGVSFQTVNYYVEVLNPLLPGIEDNVNLTLNFFRILNVQNCESPCQLNQDDTVFAETAATVFLHGELIQNGPFNSAWEDPEWASTYQYFETIYDRDLTGDNIAFFLIRAQAASQDPPAGALSIGGLLGEGQAIVGDISPEIFPFFNFDMVAYVVNTNWVNMAEPFAGDFYSDGIDYVRTQEAPGWDASYIGDIIQMDIAETDILAITVNGNVTVETTDSYSSQVNLDANIGFSFGDGEDDGNGGGINLASPLGFRFQSNNASTRRSSTTEGYTIMGERVTPLGTVTFRYQDEPNATRYPNSSYQSLFVLADPGDFGLSSGYSYGHNPDTRATWDHDPFSLRPMGSPGLQTPSYQMLNENQIHFIDLIRIVE